MPNDNASAPKGRHDWPEETKCSNCSHDWGEHSPIDMVCNHVYSTDHRNCHCGEFVAALSPKDQEPQADIKRERMVCAVCGCARGKSREDSSCETISPNAAHTWVHKPPEPGRTDTKIVDWIEEFISTGLLESSFELDGGIHLTLSTVGDAESVAYREQNSFREAAIKAMNALAGSPAASKSSSDGLRSEELSTVKEEEVNDAKR